MEPTQYSLLQRAIQNDKDAWEQLVTYYREYIKSMLFRFNVPSRDVEDLTQDILITLWDKLNEFDKNRSKFRTYLVGIIRFKSFNLIRKIARSKEKEMELPELASEDVFEEYAEREWKAYLVRVATEKVKSSFRGDAMEVFERTMQGEDVAAIAKDLDIKETSVYQLKQRVKKRCFM